MILTNSSVSGNTATTEGGGGGIREITATATVTNAPLTISRTDVTIRLKRR